MTAFVNHVNHEPDSMGHNQRAESIGEIPLVNHVNHVNHELNNCRILKGKRCYRGRGGTRGHNIGLMAHNGSHGSRAPVFSLIWACRARVGNRWHTVTPCPLRLCPWWAAAGPSHGVAVAGGAEPRHFIPHRKF
jgi:hypothetical protein